MSKLLPCPFCGGEARVGRNIFSGLFHAGCSNDECLGFSGLGWTYKKEEEAIEAWNRRANECDRDELLNIADDIDRIADNASTDSIGAFLQVSTIRPAVIKAVADRIRKALEVE